MKFVISIPIWGAWHTHTALHTVFPSVFAALDYAKAADRARFIIHTPSPDSFKEVLAGREVEYLPLAPHPVEYLRFATSHKEVLFRAAQGEAICLLCADLILCRELFSFTEEAFSNDKRAIAVLGPRTYVDPTTAPSSLSARTLSEWTVGHFHPNTFQNIFKYGRSMWPSTVYFWDAAGVSCHAFHLHPIMVLKDRHLNFHGSTIDDDLGSCFTEDEIHVATNNEISICEVSPMEKQLGLGNVIDENGIAQWACGNVSARHLWNFKHRIVLTDQGANSQSIADAILHRVENDVQFSKYRKKDVQHRKY